MSRLANRATGGALSIVGHPAEATALVSGRNLPGREVASVRCSGRRLPGSGAAQG